MSCRSKVGKKRGTTFLFCAFFFVHVFLVGSGAFNIKEGGGKRKKEREREKKKKNLEEGSNGGGVKFCSTVAMSSHLTRASLQTYQVW